MASPTLISPISKPHSLSPSLSLLKPKPSLKPTLSATAATISPPQRRREFISLSATWLLLPISPALASPEEEYVKETSDVINRVRSTINKDRNDPTMAEAVTKLRESSNEWVAKYRKEKQLLGRASFRDMYSALNAVSGHYISFGPTAPIPAKRKARILEEMDTAEKALSRGR